ncbi:MAG TPA: hypothetical protein VN408_15375, partial [Actinoplanes sp.]|nr:hypothetical protein [Actinoplanes sp.]
MTVLAAGAAIVDLPVAGMWSIAAIVLDADGLAVAAPPVVTVTSPAGVVTTPSVDVVTTGVYRVDQVVATPGRWTARAVAAGYGVVDFVAQVSGPTTG